MKRLEYDGKSANILAYRTQIGTPVGTVWRFIADNDVTIMVFPYKYQGVNAGKAHDIPETVNSLLAYSPMGAALSYVAAASSEQDLAERVHRTCVGPKCPALIGLGQAILDRLHMLFAVPREKEQSATPNENMKVSPLKPHPILKLPARLTDFDYRELLRAVEDAKNDGKEILEYVYNSLPADILKITNSEVAQIQRSLRCTRKWAWREFMHGKPYLAHFRTTNGYALVTKMQVAPQDIGDVEALQNLGYRDALSVASFNIVFNQTGVTNMGAVNIRPPKAKDMQEAGDEAVEPEVVASPQMPAAPADTDQSTVNQASQQAAGTLPADSSSKPLPPNESPLSGQVPSTHIETQKTDTKMEGSKLLSDRYKGKKHLKPADVYEILDTNRYGLNQLIRRGELNVSMIPVDAKNDSKKQMRQFLASDVFALADKNKKSV